MTIEQDRTDLELVAAPLELVAAPEPDTPREVVYMATDATMYYTPAGGGEERSITLEELRITAEGYLPAPLERCIILGEGMIAVNGRRLRPDELFVANLRDGWVEVDGVRERIASFHTSVMGGMRAYTSVETVEGVQRQRAEQERIWAEQRARVRERQGQYGECALGFVDDCRMHMLAGQHAYSRNFRYGEAPGNGFEWPEMRPISAVGLVRSETAMRSMWRSFGQPTELGPAPAVAAETDAPAPQNRAERRAAKHGKNAGRSRHDPTKDR
jgi:hypothetical protein